jgi:hypothetical protein
MEDKDNASNISPEEQQAVTELLAKFRFSRFVHELIQENSDFNSKSDETYLDTLYDLFSSYLKVHKQPMEVLFDLSERDRLNSREAKIAELVDSALEYYPAIVEHFIQQKGHLWPTTAHKRLYIYLNILKESSLVEQAG